MILESIFGKPDPNTWRPLPLSTLFSEGWNEAWVPSPNGSGGAPRQGWINAADGNLYRLWFFTFAQGFNQGPKGNAYLGAYTLFTPLSRRLDLIINVPFVVRNNAASGLPIINPTGLTMPTSKSHTTFGDISFTPRVLLHETKDFSLTAEIAVLTPTGNQPLAGKTALIPAVGFWNNFAGGWVIRGGLGDYDPARRQWEDNLISQLAIGQTLTDHDVPLFGDFTCYVSTVVNTPLSNGQPDQRDADPRHAHAPGQRLVFPGRSTNAVDQPASRRHRHDLLVHEGVVSPSTGLTPRARRSRLVRASVHPLSGDPVRRRSATASSAAASRTTW